MGLMALFCRTLCRCEKIGSIYFTCKNSREQKSDPYTEEPELASASLEEDFGAVVSFCCGTLSFSRLIHGQRSWVRIPASHSWCCSARVSFPGLGQAAHVQQLCRPTLLNCLKSKVAPEAIIINPWEEMQAFWTSADCWNKPHPTKKL